MASTYAAEPSRIAWMYVSQSTRSREPDEVGLGDAEEAPVVAAGLATAAVGVAAVKQSIDTASQAMEMRGPEDRGPKNVKEMAKELSEEAGRNRVSAQTPEKRIDYDLQGQVALR